MNTKSDLADRLRLGAVPHPAQAGAQVPFFSDWQSACQHLRDHLLTAPECLGWLQVAPEYGQILNPNDGDARWSYSEQAAASAGRTAQALYDLYRSAVSRDAGDAAVLGWHRSRERTTVCLGTSGIVTIIEQTVRTAFLPGQGTPEGTLAGREPDQQQGLPRERGMRSGRPGRRDQKMSDRDRQVREQREAAWSRSQRLYYRVFKPAVQSVKQCHHRNRNMYGKLVRSDYALLKDALPHLSQFKYEDWAALRQRCGRDE